MILEASTLALSLLLATQTTPSSRNKKQQQEILDMVGIGTKDQGRSAPEKEADVGLPETVPGEGGFSTKPKTQTLTLLHSADQEADLISHRAVGGISRFVSVLNKLKGLSNNPVVVASGDTFLPSPSLRLTMDKENAVVAANNLVGFQVAAVGNHEFDLGDAFFAEVIEAASFPYISSNMSIVGGELAKVFQAQPLDKPAPWLQDKAGKLIQRGKYCAGGKLTTVPPEQMNDPRPVYPGLKIKIIAGDNLRSLAQKAYGSKELWETIYQKNQLVIKDPDNLQADAEVHIPLLEGMSPQYCTGVTVGVGQGKGHFPQVSKEVFLEYDPEGAEQVPLVSDNKVIGIKKAGQRVRNLYINTKDIKGKKTIIKIVEDGKILTPDQKITCATTFFLSRGGDGYFPGAVQEIAVTPIARKHKGKVRHLTEQTAVKQYIRRLKKKKKWKEGKSYLDPDPKNAASFGRIIAKQPKS